MIAVVNPALLGVAALVVVAFAVIYFLNRRRADLSIIVSGQDVRFSGAVPAAKQATITQFLTKDMDLPERVTIRGRRVPQGWRFAVLGALPPGDQQRIRNFLLTTL